MAEAHATEAPTRQSAAEEGRDGGDSDGEDGGGGCDGDGRGREGDFISQGINNSVNCET